MKKQLVLAALAFCLLFSDHSMAAEKNGWRSESGGSVYYVKGTRVKGLKKIGSHTYYFKKEDGTLLKNRWLLYKGKYYYFQSRGRMVTSSWIGQNCYVGKDGALVTNQWIGKKFVGEDGRWIKGFKGGWRKIKGKWYYYTAAGRKRTGWITYRNQRYYLDKNGVRITQFTTINKKNYQFNKNGILQKSTWVKRNGLYYRAGENGVVDMREGYNTKDPSTATRIVYKSSTIFVDLKKSWEYGTNYWTAHIKVKNTDQLRSSMAYGTYGGALETTSAALTRNNGIIGINGSRYDASGRPAFNAVLIRKGRIYNHALGTSYSLMAIKRDGTMYTPKQGLSAEQLVADGVYDTFDFGPAFIMNGRNQDIISPFEEYQNNPYPRSAVGMIRRGEYVLLVADGSGKVSTGSRGLDHYQLCNIFQRYGCVYAYQMDGGGSATLAYRGRVLNNPSDGSERPVADFLYFRE